MGSIMHGGINYTGGGSNVIANPTGSATDTIEKIGIDGDIYAIEDADAVHTSDIGTANGVAELDANGLVPSSQLPSYVDDYVEGYYDSNTDRFYEESTFTTVIPPTDGKSWVDVLTNKSYRWTGSVYTRVDEGVQLGETSSTAYRGDRGKTAYDHATESGRSGAKSAGLYKMGVTAQGHVASANAVAKADLTALGVADQNDVDAIEDDIQGYKTVTGKYITVTDAASLPAESYQIDLSPVQNLNGYDSPWVGGAGDSQFGYGIGAPDVSGTYNGWAITYNTNARLVLFDNDTTADISGLFFGFTVNGSDASGGQAYWLIQNGVENEKNRLTTSYHYISIYPTTQEYLDKLFARYKVMCVVDNHGYSEYIPYQNICPIHGADEVGVRVCGVNLFDKTDTDTTNGYSANNYLDVSGVAVYSDNYNISEYIRASGQYTITPISGGNPSLGFYDSNKAFISGVAYSGQSSLTFTTPTNAAYVRVSIPKANVDTLQIVNGSNVPTDYHPFNGHSTTITLPSTVYGGSVEQGGSGSVTMANIASYNGETINEPWISSMDKYEAGATPTTGAQVVYPLTTPTALNVTPFTVELLESVNNIWAEMKENSVVIDNAQQSLSYQPQNIVGELRQEIEAKPDSFAQLSDTSFSNLANGQIPKWNSTSQKWENANESGGGGLPAWTKIWNYKSGATFTMPIGKTDIMLVIVSTLVATRLTSAFYPVEYPFSYTLAVEYTLADGAVGLDINTSNAAHPWIDSTQFSLSDFDFEIWVR